MNRQTIHVSVLNGREESRKESKQENDGVGVWKDLSDKVALKQKVEGNGVWGVQMFREQIVGRLSCSLARSEGS